MVTEIEKLSGHFILRENQVLTNALVESQAVKLNGFDMVELGIWYQAHSAAPVGAKVVFRIQFSFDGSRYFDYATSQDMYPGGSAVGISSIRTIIFVRDFELAGKPNVIVTAWHNLRTAARYLRVAAQEQNNAGQYGTLLVACRASDA